jgi:heme O synthase-like polyprenyltransferase
MTAAYTVTPALTGTRFTDYLQLTRPRLCVMALVAASLTPVAVSGAGPVYLAGALLLGIGFLTYAVGFSRRRSTERARAVLWASLIYLPALLTLWLLDGTPHG